MKEIFYFHLTNNEIQSVLNKTQKQMADAKISKKNILRIQLLIEEGLLNFQAAFGEEKKASLQLSSLFSHVHMTISVQGIAYDPLREYDEGSSTIVTYILSEQSLLPVWRYKNGCNCLTFSFRKKQKKLNPIFSFLIAVALAVIAFLICNALPANIGTFLTENITTPFYNKFIGVINAIAGPLIFVSVVWGIYSIGDTASLSQIGKKMIGHFMLTLIAFSGIVMLLLLLVYPVSSAAGGNFAFSDLFKMILDIIPENIVAPFYEGNSLQIIFLAVIIGISALILSEKTTIIVEIINQTNAIVQLIMSTVSKLIPVFIFLSLFSILNSEGFVTLTGSWKVLLTFIGGCLFCLILYAVILSIRKKIPLRLLWQKLLPTFIIAVTTASSASAFSCNLETCKDKLGIDEKLVHIGVPLGQVIYMIATSVMYICFALYLAEFYGIAVSIPWLLALLLVAVVLSIASPPIPGGALIAYAVLLKQMGIPDEGLLICTALNMFTDFLVTASNLSLLQMELVEIAGSLDMLDVEVLKSEE